MLSVLTEICDFRCNNALRKLLIKYEKLGGVLDYVPFVCSDKPSIDEHRDAAVEGMRMIKKSCEIWAEKTSSKSLPIEQFFHLKINHTNPDGRSVTFEEFWGTYDVEPKSIGEGAWSIPEINGYKPAFFHPPYGLRQPIARVEKLFESINREVLGPKDSRGEVEVFSWATDWSNYFEAGHEWWGAYFWTVYSPPIKMITIVGASSTD